MLRRVGVENVSVDVVTKIVEVRYNPAQIAESDLSRLLSMLGFPSQNRSAACAC